MDEKSPNLSNSMKGVQDVRSDVGFRQIEFSDPRKDLWYEGVSLSTKEEGNSFSLITIIPYSPRLDTLLREWIYSLYVPGVGSCGRSTGASRLGRVPDEELDTLLRVRDEVSHRRRTVDGR